MPRPDERESIELVERLWDLACKRLLGILPRHDYRRAAETLLGGRGRGKGARSRAVHCESSSAG